MQPNNIPNNTNVTEIINETLKITPEITKSIDSVVKTITKLTDNIEYKSLIGSTSKLKKVSSMVAQYMSITKEIISALVVPPNEKDYKHLFQLCGYIEKNNGEKIINGKKEKMVEVQYRNIDSILKISSVMNGLMGGMAEMMKVNVGLKSYINFRTNLRLMKKYMKQAISELIVVLGDIAKDPKISNIMEVLVSDPEIINEIIEDKENWDRAADEKQSYDKGDKSSYRILETKKGKQGLLDVIKGTFDILKLMLDIQVPPYRIMKKKMKNVKSSYMLAFESIKEIAGLTKDNTTFKNLQMFGKMLRGTGKNGDDGLSGSVTNLFQVVDTLCEMGNAQISKKLEKLRNKTIDSFKVILQKIAGIFSTKKSEAIDILVSANTQKKIEKISEVINSIELVITDLLKITAKLTIIGSASVILVPLSIPIKLSIACIKWFIKGLISISEYITENKVDFKILDEKLSEIVLVIVDLNKIALASITLGLMALPAIAALILDSIFMLALLGFIKLVNWTFNVIDKVINRDFKKSTKDLTLMILCMIGIQLSLIAMAVLATVSINAIKVGVIFLGALLVFIAAAAVIMWLSGKVITTNSFLAFLELSAFILIIAVIESVMLIIGSFAMKATVACLTGVLFLGALLIFLTLLVLVGTLVISLAPIIVPAIGGLLAIVVMLGIFIAIAALISAISQITTNISVGNILKVVGSLLLIIPMMVAVGMMGLGATIAAGLMVGIVALVTQFLIITKIIEDIYNVKFDSSNITKKITEIKTIVSNLKDEFGKLSFSRDAVKTLRNATASMRIFLRLTNKLNKLSTITINSDLITKNIDKVFITIKALESKLETFETSKETFKSDKADLRRSGRLVSKVHNIYKTINEIQQHKIDEGLVLSNLSACFSSIGSIETFIETWNSIDKETFKTNKKQFRRSNRILSFVEDIARTISEIQNVKIDEGTIITRLTSLFGAVDKIDELIDARLGLDDTKKSDVVAMRAQKRALRQENKLKELEAKNIDKITSIMINIGDMTSTITELSNLKTDTPTIIKKTENLMDCVDQVYTTVSNKLNKTYAPLNTDSLSGMLGYIKELNDTVSSLSDISEGKIKNTEKMIGNYVNFLDKINTVKVENLEKSAQMFKQMARFSESINGNFDSLAESLNEKLMPVLEELKDIMEKVPGSLDKGFANTSRSIISTSQSPISQSTMTQQVQMENPNISKEDLDRIVKTRLNEQARMQSNSIVSKVDELIELLSTGKVKVETV